MKKIKPYEECFKDLEIEETEILGVLSSNISNFCLNLLWGFLFSFSNISLLSLFELKINFAFSFLLKSELNIEFFPEYKLTIVLFTIFKVLFFKLGEIYLLVKEGDAKLWR